jgi:hypothetical protein
LPSKEIRAYVEDRFKRELEELGFAFYSKPQIGLRYTRKSSNERTQCVSLRTGSKFGAIIEIYLLLYFQEITNILECLLIQPGLTLKKQELVVWEYTQAFSFILDYIPPHPKENGTLVSSLEEADKVIDEELALINDYGFSYLESYQSIQSLVDALENNTVGFNRNLLFNHMAVPIIYGLGGMSKKAIEHVEKKYLDRSQDYVLDGTVGFYRFSKNVKVWLEHGAPVDCSLMNLQ